MSVFQKRPLHVRRKIALVATIGVGVILIAILFFFYTHKSVSGDSTSTSQITNFYHTIISPQSSPNTQK